MDKWFIALTRFHSGFTRGRLHLAPKSAKADLGGELSDQVRRQTPPANALVGAGIELLLQVIIAA
jgi:hypothetical protein